MVDYYGACKAVGLLDTNHPCSNVKCPRNLPVNCLGFIPTGSCCPICGGAIKIMFSKKQIDRGLYALNNTQYELLTLKAILSSLQRLIKVSSCFLSGFLTFETDLYVIVYPIDKNPSMIEIEVCREEAMIISNLINIKSHHFSSSISLSSLVVANYVKPSVSLAVHSTQSIGLLIISILIAKLL
jgi:reversion-inducing cysteine-rich kazal motif protein